MAKKPSKKKSSGNNWVSEEAMWDTTMSSDDDDDDHNEFLLDMEPSKASDAFSREVPVDEDDDVFEDAREVWDDGLAKAENAVKKEAEQFRNSASDLKKKQQLLNANRAGSSPSAKTPEQQVLQQKRLQQQKFNKKAQQTQEIKKRLREKREKELQSIKVDAKRQPRKPREPESRPQMDEDVVFGGGQKKGGKKVFLVIGIILLGFVGGYVIGNKDTLFKGKAAEYKFKADKYKTEKTKVTPKKIKKRKPAPVRNNEFSNEPAMVVEQEITDVENPDPLQNLAIEPGIDSEYGRTEEVSGTLASVVDSRLPNTEADNKGKSSKLTAAEIQVALDESVIRLGQKDWNAVVTLSDRIIKSDSAVSSAFINRSVAYTELGLYKQAIQDCDLVIATEPNNGIAYNNRAYAYEKMNKLKQAVADYETACQLGVGPSCIEAQVLAPQVEL